MSRQTGRGLSIFCTLLLLVSLTGCIGLYDNSPLFLNDPAAGMSEADVIKNYGAPAFATSSGSETIYVYKVRKTRYVVLAGVYEGHDLVVRFNNGVVVETHKVANADALAILQPVPWAVTD